MDKLDLKPLVDASARRRMPAIIAHRGARREAPENTLPAIQRALDLGAQGIEFDVLLTKDKVPIVTHNDDLSIFTHYRGYAHATPFATVRSLDAGSHFSTQHAGVVMPTLAEALEIVDRHDVLTIVEIKAQPGLAASAAEIVGGVISDFRMRGPLMISSASMHIIHEVAHRHPRIPRALIVRNRAFSFFRTALFGRFAGLAAIHPSLSALTPGLVDRARRHGVLVQAWTANEPEGFDLCIALEVDGLITDDVAYARQYLEEAFGIARR